MNISTQIKMVLMDIIDQTYPDKDKKTKRAYKDFSLEIKQDIRKSFMGKYSHKNKTIYICNIFRNPKHSVITTLHELAHHIEYIDKGTTGHSKNFYSIFEKLVHSALDMGIIHKSDILMVKDTSDRNKMDEFVKTYVPHRTGYEEGYKYVIVYNGYSIKDSLKKDGYSFSSFDKTWVKKFIDEEADKESLRISKLSDKINIELRRANDILINSVGYIVVTGKTYEHKDTLKKLGYYYKNKKWIKKVSSDTAESELNNISYYKLDDCKTEFQYDNPIKENKKPIQSE